MRNNIEKALLKFVIHTSSPFHFYLNKSKIIKKSDNWVLQNLHTTSETIMGIYHNEPEYSLQTIAQADIHYNKLNFEGVYLSFWLGERKVLFS